jgi:hypothetical protein
MAVASKGAVKVRGILLLALVASFFATPVHGRFLDSADAGAFAIDPTSTEHIRFRASPAAVR